MLSGGRLRHATTQTNRDSFQSGGCRADIFSGASAAIAAGLFAPTGNDASNEPTEIVSDRLVNNNTDKVAEFTGAVKATQGNFSITTDTLRIHYEGDLINPPKDTSAKNQ